MRRYMVLLVGVALVASAGIAVAQTTSGTLNACAKTNNGQLRLVNGPDDCTPSEYFVSWNEIGVQGPQGPAGPAGPQGEPGGTTGFVVVETPVVTAVGERNSDTVTQVLSCPTGMTAINGGYYVLDRSAFALANERWAGEGHPVGGDWVLDVPVAFSAEDVTAVASNMVAFAVCG